MNEIVKDKTDYIELTTMSNPETYCARLICHIIEQLIVLKIYISVCSRYFNLLLFIYLYSHHIIIFLSSLTFIFSASSFSFLFFFSHHLHKRKRDREREEKRKQERTVQFSDSHSLIIIGMKMVPR